MHRIASVDCLVVGRIIDRFLQGSLGYRDSNVFVPVLFYADDGIVLARNVDEAEQMIGVLVEVSRECGLSLNREKSQVLIYNSREPKPEYMGEIGVVDSIRYLGILVECRRDCFRAFKQERILLAEKMANVAFSVVARSCSRVVVGKAFWKGVVLPSVLFGSAVISWNVEELGRLQRVENRVWRLVLGAPQCTAVAAIRGEIGASTMEARDYKGKIGWAKFMGETGNGLLGAIFRKMNDDRKPGRWIRQTWEYMNRVGISMGTLGVETVRELKDRVDRWETARWKEEIGDKSTLVWYR